MAKTTTFFVMVFVPLAVVSATGCDFHDDDTTVLSGRVTSLGVPVANSRVIVMNRITDREHNTTTDSDGNYSIHLENGYYDIGADNGRGEEATIYGLVILQGTPIKRDFELPTDMPDEHLSGVVYTTETTPASNYRLHFYSNIQIDGSNSLDMETFTNEKGEFSLSMETGRVFDISIYDEMGEMIETIDIQKLSGALRIFIELGTSDDNNRFRHDESSNEITQAESVTRRAFAASDTKRDFAFSSWQSSSYDHQVKQTLVNQNYELNNGRLCVDEGFLSVEESSFPDTVENFGINVKSLADRTIDISVRNDGSWWYEYAVTITVNLSRDQWIFNFTDEEPDTYGLKIATLGTHKVSYDSSKPCLSQVASNWVLKRQP